MTRLLVTGFGPFPRVPRNPSGVLAERIARSRRFRLRGVEVESLVLPTSYGAIDAVLRPTLARFRPDAVLLLGVAARRRAVCVERQALNRVSRLFPDASGRTGTRLAVSPRAPLVLRPRAPVGALLRAVRAGAVPARLSRDAGRYLCNASYFAVLEDAGREGPLVVFVHVPMPRGSRPRDPRPTLIGMERAIRDAALVLASRAGRPPSPLGRG